MIYYKYDILYKMIHKMFLLILELWNKENTWTNNVVFLQYNNNAFAISQQMGS